jgi:hypothetical protein
MRKTLYIPLVFVAVCLLACGDRHIQEKEALRRQIREEFYQQELAKVQEELAHTDSLLAIAQADSDTLNVSKRIYLDSLQQAFDVQGAMIRYIHRKQEQEK